MSELGELLKLAELMKLEPNPRFSAATKADINQVVGVLQAQDRQISSLSTQVTSFDRDLSDLVKAHNGVAATGSSLSLLLGVALTVFGAAWGVDRWRLERRFRILETRIKQIGL